RPPLATTVPNALPPDMLALIRRPQLTAVSVPDSNVKPAGAAMPLARPMHGAMTAGQSVVYVLDCSRSLGELGNLAAAGAALIATLRRHPEGVRFQVVVYNSTARVALPGGLVPATAANLAAAEAKLVTVEPSGRSNHAEAVRIAAGLRP